MPEPVTPIFNDTTLPPASYDRVPTPVSDPATPRTVVRRSISSSGYPRIDTYSYLPNGSTYLSRRDVVHELSVERWDFNETERCINYAILDRQAADEGLTPEEAEAQRLEYDRMIAERDAERRREVDERNRRLREGNHWVILSNNRGSGYIFGRDQYSSCTQQEAKDAHIAFLKEDMGAHLREINRQMDAVKRVKAQIAQVESLELWPDPTAEIWPTPETGETCQG